MKLNSLEDILAIEILPEDLSKPESNLKVRELHICGNDLDQPFELRVAALRHMIKLYSTRMGISEEERKAIDEFPDIDLVTMYGSQHGRDVRYVLWYCVPDQDHHAIIADLNFTFAEMAEFAKIDEPLSAGIFRTMRGATGPVYGVHGESVELGVKSRPEDLDILLSKVMHPSQGDLPPPAKTDARALN